MQNFCISLHKLSAGVCYLRLHRVTIRFYDNRQLTVFGLCDYNSNLLRLTFVYVQADGSESLLIALQEVSPY